MKTMKFILACVLLLSPLLCQAQKKGPQRGSFYFSRMRARKRRMRPLFGCAKISSGAPCSAI